MIIKTRFAPSPTGFLHIGGARTALFSWIYALKHQGEFFVRIENTDSMRSTDEYSKIILDSLDWLGIRSYENKIFYQMERLEIYRNVIKELINNGNAYYCYCSKEDLEIMRKDQIKRGEKPRYDKRWRPENVNGLIKKTNVKPVIRFRNPDSGIVQWDDLVKGNISISNEELDDFVICRSDGIPTYNFSVVVDDSLMEISHVIRGDDHVNNTPRQINLFRALGYKLPKFAHLPMILGEDGERLSKRHGAISVLEYKEKGILAKCLLNYLARLGWSHGDVEKFSINQMIEWFDFKNVNRSGAKFDENKLEWLNQQYLKETDNKNILPEILSRFEKENIKIIENNKLLDLIDIFKKKNKNLNGLFNNIKLFYHFDEVEDLAYKDLVDEITKKAILNFKQNLNDINWDLDSINFLIKKTIKENQLNMRDFAMPLRIILTGKHNTPSIDLMLRYIGREESIERIDIFLKKVTY